MASAASQRIVLIIAPAGYGKSVALSQYLASHTGPFVRYDLRSENGTLLGFVRGLADALCDVSPDARKTVSSAYEAARSSKTAAADLAMWMHAHIKAFSGVIAIDDLHVAENDPTISHFLANLIERTKGRTRWIIASRSSLDLPVGSWLAYGETDLTVDEQDLRFTAEEAREAARHSRVSVRNEELNEILEMTDGWPTAISFALRTSTRSVDLRNIAANTREMVYRFLAEQVYLSLSDGERDLLLFSSFLEDIDLDVLREAGYGAAKGIIEALRDRVAFIYPSGLHSYRCHDLFRDFLRYQLELKGDAAVEATCLRAAVAFEKIGNDCGALRLYAQARASDSSLRVLERSGYELMDDGRSDIVRAALQSLPQDIRATNTVALAMRGLAAADTGRFDRAESLLARAISGATTVLFKARLCIKLSLVLINQMRDPSSILEALSADDLPIDVRAEVASLLAVSYSYSGRLKDADAAISSADAMLPSVESDRDRAKILQRLGAAISHRGTSFNRSFDALNRAAKIASSEGMFALAGRAFSALASIALLYDSDTTKEIWYAQQAVNAGTKAGDTFGIQTALLQLMNAEARRGNRERINILERQLASILTTDSERSAYVLPVRAMVAAWDGSFTEAARLLSLICDSPRLYDFDRAFNNSLRALFQVAEKQRDRAISIIESLTFSVDSLQPQSPYGERQVQMARLLCAISESLAGRHVNAQRLMRKAQPGSDPLVEALRDIAGAIARSAKRGVPSDEIYEQLETLTAMGHGGLSRALELVVDKSLDAVEAEGSGLTRAQLEILAALAEGRGPKEIAAETGRSVYTIQSHIQGIIKKLGCSGRHEALSVARRRNLVK